MDQCPRTVGLHQHRHPNLVRVELRRLQPLVTTLSKEVSPNDCCVLFCPSRPLVVGIQEVFPGSAEIRFCEGGGSEAVRCPDERIPNIKTSAAPTDDSHFGGIDQALVRK